MLFRGEGENRQGASKSKKSPKPLYNVSYCQFYVLQATSRKQFPMIATQDALVTVTNIPMERGRKVKGEGVVVYSLREDTSFFISI
ncbi:hypothetical protein P5673_019583 [Acropora cervicornis]|uniref:Uncharacterized protein n=1 Tax=Acropora cervicornis TaxID=6130 RepID=A0AAD9QB63_ACRCE|nr:hypothetical protein P5673_019583 [Acropora cervicornis]